jgi:hypothetical protein
MFPFLFLSPTHIRQHKEKQVKTFYSENFYLVCYRVSNPTPFGDCLSYGIHYLIAQIPNVAEQMATNLSGGAIYCSFWSESGSVSEATMCFMSSMCLKSPCEVRKTKASNWSQLRFTLRRHRSNSPKSK